MRIGRCAAALIFCGGCLQAQQAAIFEFHSSFWVNLHQFLYDQATDEKSPPAGTAAWQEAVGYYRRVVVKHNLLDGDMAAINNRLARAGSAGISGETGAETSAAILAGPGLDRQLAATLAKVAGEYRQTWWPQHDRQNRAWIEAVRPLLAKYGAAMKDEIAGAFQTRWPAEPVRTEVSAKAGWAGAYTTVDPTLITVASTEPDYQGPASLEMLFHEASHALDAQVNAALTAELEAQKLLFRRRGFGHAVLFYTAGEIARRHLGEDYQPVGIRYGILERGWPGSVAVLEKDWKPYLEGRSSFADAVRAAVKDYGVARNQP